MNYILTYFGDSDIGHVRKNNEDAWSKLKDHHFFALADGMGGHKAGEIAAAEAVNNLCLEFKDHLSTDPLLTHDALQSFFYDAIMRVNHGVYTMGQDKEEYQGMGSTLSTLFFDKQNLFIGHVGDSRIYRLRDGEIKQLTEDHTLENLLRMQGKLEAAKASNYSYKNRLTRSIGTSPEIKPEIAVVPLHLSDVYLMCSDGLTSHLSDKEISMILQENRSLRESTQQLIDAAKARGGRDNITVILIRVDESTHGKDLPR